MLESGSWGHSVLQTPALVLFFFHKRILLRHFNEYPQHMILWRNEKTVNTFQVKEKSTCCMNILFATMYVCLNAS